jgi:hypothetical protein
LGRRRGAGVTRRDDEFAVEVLKRLLRGALKRNAHEIVALALGRRRQAIPSRACSVKQPKPAEGSFAGSTENAGWLSGVGPR